MTSSVGKSFALSVNLNNNLENNTVSLYQQINNHFKLKAK